MRRFFSRTLAVLASANKGRKLNNGFTENSDCKMRSEFTDLGNRSSTDVSGKERDDHSCRAARREAVSRRIGAGEGRHEDPVSLHALAALRNEAPGLSAARRQASVLSLLRAGSPSASRVRKVAYDQLIRRGPRKAASFFHGSRQRCFGPSLQRAHSQTLCATSSWRRRGSRFVDWSRDCDLKEMTSADELDAVGSRASRSRVRRASVPDRTRLPSLYSAAARKPWPVGVSRAQSRDVPGGGLAP